MWRVYGSMNTEYRIPRDRLCVNNVNLTTLYLSLTFVTRHTLPSWLTTVLTFPCYPVTSIWHCTVDATFCLTVISKTTNRASY